MASRKRKRTIRRIKYVPRGPSTRGKRRRARKNPAALPTALMIGGAVLATIILYRLLSSKKAPAQVVAPQVAATETVAALPPASPSVGGGIADALSRMGSMFGAIFSPKTATAGLGDAPPVMGARRSYTGPSSLAGGVLKGGRFGSLG
jgi:hypothetical protein